MSCSFLALPGELRHKVYSYLLRDEEKVYVRAINVSTGRYRHFPRSGQFLLTCRAIHSEALPVLYGSPTFTAQYVADLANFFGTIGIDGRKYIKKLRLGPLPFGMLTSELQQHLQQDTWTQLESLQQITLEHKTYGPRHKFNDSGLRFLQRLVKSTPQPGQFMYDYMDLIRRSGVQWSIELSLMLYSHVFTTPPSANVPRNLEEVIIAVDVDIAKSEHDGAGRESWILKGRDEEDIVPRCRQISAKKDPIWERLEPLRL